MKLISTAVIFLILGSQLYSQDNFSKNINTSNLFEENKGQVSGKDAHKVNFIYKDNGLSIFLMTTGISYQFNKVHYPEGYKQINKFSSPEERDEMMKLNKFIRNESYRMDLELIDVNENAIITTEGKSNDFVNYYNHNAFNVFSYSKIIYHDIYPSIDWVIYINNDKIKYDFVVRSGGNPDEIKFKSNWVENLTINKDGSLSLLNRMGCVTEKKPISFQNDKIVSTEFNVTNDVISFKLKGFNNKETLVIDPSLVWSTYYGGAGTSDYGYATCTDGVGNVYLAGESDSGSSIASGGHQNTYGGGGDAYLVKFNSLGIRQWGSYYGGTTGEYAFSCAVDASDNVYITGATSSSTNIAFGGHDNVFSGGTFDAFLVKFNSAGVRQWATYYGGTGSDYGNSCVTDASGNVYMAGSTSSGASIATVGSHDATYNGINDAFLVKFNNAGVRQWATYYGGADNDTGTGCAVDASGNVFLCGITESTIAISTVGSHQTTYGGGLYDDYIVKFNNAGVRQWASYYGGSSSDQAANCVTDVLGNIYLTGYTSSTTNISTIGSHQNIYGGGSFDAFLVKLNTSGVRQWATYYGGPSDDVSYNCTTDLSNNVYLTGFTQSTVSIASGGFQNIYGGGSTDAYLVKINSLGAFQWGSYFGGPGSDQGYSCSVDGSSNIYLAGWTTSSVNIASGGHDNTLDGTRDGFLVKLSNVVCVPTITVTASQYTICTGTNVTFTTSITDGGTSPTYQWQLNGTNVGLGLSSYSNTAFTNTDVISCLLTSNATCASTTAIASNSVMLTVNPLPSITVNNGSICSGASFTISPTGASTYTYSSGSNVISPLANQTYTVIGESTQGCINTAVSNVTVNALPIVNATSNNTIICVGQTANLTATGATSYTWNTSETTSVIVITPTNTTTYTLIGIDNNGCIGSTTITQNVSTCTGINAVNLNKEQEIINIFPNPSNGSFTIELINYSKITITNALGQEVIAITCNEGTHTLNLNNEVNGVYFIKVIYGNTQTIKRLVINK